LKIAAIESILKLVSLDDYGNKTIRPDQVTLAFLIIEEATDEFPLKTYSTNTKKYF